MDNIFNTSSYQKTLQTFLNTKQTPTGMFATHTAVHSPNNIDNNLLGRYNITYTPFGSGSGSGSGGSVGNGGNVGGDMSYTTNPFTGMCANPTTEAQRLWCRDISASDRELWRSSYIYDLLGR